MNLKNTRPFLLLAFISIAFFVFNCSNKNPDASKSSKNEHLVMSVLYVQTAAEVRALCYQAFNIAKLRLNAALDTLPASKKAAVIVDIDETLLDNSPYEAYLIKTDQSYPAGWDEWIGKAAAKAIPGAVPFLQFAAQKGADIFYVSNRKIKTLQKTLSNLQKAGFPQATESHLYLRKETSSKESRRQIIAKTHQIILLIGDNLNDFAQVFEKKTVEDRFNETDRLKDQFGKKFIVLPNPMYGEWEGAVYDYHWKMSETEKAKKRKEALKSF